MRLPPTCLLAKGLDIELLSKDDIYRAWLIRRSRECFLQWQQLDQCSVFRTATVWTWVWGSGLLRFSMSWEIVPGKLCLFLAGLDNIASVSALHDNFC